MRKISLRQNEKAQVLGLPMYLIIIMIVAVAVIAAVLFMMPQGTKTIEAYATENYLIAEASPTGGMEEFTFASSYTVTITVATNDKNANPISGATVTLTGAGTSGAGVTDSNGIAQITVTPALAENEKDAYMILEVKAAGYEDFSKAEAVHVHRDI